MSCRRAGRSGRRRRESPSPDRPASRSTRGGRRHRPWRRCARRPFRRSPRPRSRSSSSPAPRPWPRAAGRRPWSCRCRRSGSRRSCRPRPGARAPTSAGCCGTLRAARRNQGGPARRTAASNRERPSADHARTAHSAPAAGGGCRRRWCAATGCSGETGSRRGLACRVRECPAVRPGRQHATRSAGGRPAPRSTGCARQSGPPRDRQRHRAGPARRRTRRPRHGRSRRRARHRPGATRSARPLQASGSGARRWRRACQAAGLGLASRGMALESAAGLSRRGAACARSRRRMAPDVCRARPSRPRKVSGS
mmetsp:Transcript_39196/g.92151  ORF Transcript_39196/g.92151 Transcript_39196/m.92151 type:complete len:309 (+) Transcript_39196:2170-3096(+)